MTQRRSHPPTLETLVKQALRADPSLLPRGETILVGVSGGPDSTALLHVLARLRKRVGFSLVAHGVDHGLRDEAASELDLARALAGELDVPFDRTIVRVAKGGNLQARARDARRAALVAAAGKASASRIATGHHADDLAETMMIRLLRGTGVRGLACLPPRAGALVRPMILARRRDVLAHLVRHRLVCVSDPSNENPRFLRTRVRAELMPLLEALSPAIVAHLTQLATAARIEIEKNCIEGCPPNETCLRKTGPKVDACGREWQALPRPPADFTVPQSPLLIRGPCREAIAEVPSRMGAAHPDVRGDLAIRCAGEPRDGVRRVQPIHGAGAREIRRKTRRIRRHQGPRVHLRGRRSAEQVSQGDVQDARSDR